MLWRKGKLCANEHEPEQLKQERVKQSIWVAPGNLSKQGAPGEFQALSCQMGGGDSVLCPDSLGLFDHPWPLLTSVCLSCQHSTHRSFQDMSRRKGGSCEFTGSGQPLADAWLVPEHRSLWPSQYRLWSIIYTQNSSVESDWVWDFASHHILTLTFPLSPVLIHYSLTNHSHINIWIRVNLNSQLSLDKGGGGTNSCLKNVLKLFQNQMKSCI